MKHCPQGHVWGCDDGTFEFVRARHKCNACWREKEQGDQTQFKATVNLASNPTANPALRRLYGLEMVVTTPRRGVRVP